MCQYKGQSNKRIKKTFYHCLIICRKALIKFNLPSQLWSLNKIGNFKPNIGKLPKTIKYYSYGTTSESFSFKSEKR